jgi:hypothetical protein
LLLSYHLPRLPPSFTVMAALTTQYAGAAAFDRWHLRARREPLATPGRPR